MSSKTSKTVSAEEAASILHVSKRKLAWMLQQGIIPCRDTGKQTRRYTIYLDDVLKCQSTIDSIEFPRSFSSVRGSAKKENLTPVQIEQYTEFLIKRWEKESDALTVQLISKMLGYNIESVRRWLRSGKLQSVTSMGNFFVAKVWLAEFCCHYGYRIVKKSKKHIKLEKDFFNSIVQ